MAKEAASPLNNNRANFARGGTLFKSSGFWIGLLLAVTLAVLGLSSWDRAQAVTVVELKTTHPLGNVNPPVTGSSSSCTG